MQIARKTGTLDPSGCRGSTPRLGVYVEPLGLIKIFRFFFRTKSVPSFSETKVTPGVGVIESDAGDLV